MLKIVEFFFFLYIWYFTIFAT